MSTLMSTSLFLLTSLLLSAPSYSLPTIPPAPPFPNISHLTFFGDSFTDQSRSHSISNGTYPGPHYQEIYPPQDPGINGGISWPYYLSLYTGLPFDNYATGGAACSNKLTPLGPPDVSGQQLEWFVQDHVLTNASRHGPVRLDIDGGSTLAIIWIGTNDLGIHSLLEPDNYTAPYAPAIPPLAPGNDNATTIEDLANCQLSTVTNLYEEYGVRNFLVLSTIPLHLTRLYAPIDEGTIYWPQTHDGKAWNLNIYHMANALNSMLRSGIGGLTHQYRQANVQFFNTYSFFEQLYLHPQKYFNGSMPVNVTGHCHQCPNASDYHYCGMGDCVGTQHDSYMWWDELHPSEQTGRLVAMEVQKKMQGRSVY